MILPWVRFSAIYVVRRVARVPYSQRTVSIVLQRCNYSYTARAPKTPQTLTEKIVQTHAVGLPDGKLVQSGSFVSFRPERVMS